MEQRVQDFKKSEKFPEMKPKESCQRGFRVAEIKGTEMALF